jgi:hypothetical protein
MLFQMTYRELRVFRRENTPFGISSLPNGAAVEYGSGGDRIARERAVVRLSPGGGSLIAYPAIKRGRRDATPCR